MIELWIERLLNYGLDCELLDEVDKSYARNRILALLKKDDYVLPENFSEEDKLALENEDYELEVLLQHLLDYAAEQGLLESDSVVYRDLFDTALMDCLMPRPSEVVGTFQLLYEQHPKLATDWYYQLSQNSDYIRRYRISKDKKWLCDTQYGTLDITINLSKPEKDPKAIAAALKQKSASYPSCHLCKESVGYAGRVNYPARQNHRIIPIRLNEEDWGFQYSPYVYYNEHCIVFKLEHSPMKITPQTFARLLDFVDAYPHYFLGSNADLPIVGGSILTHDHFQGGAHSFAMARAGLLRTFEVKDFPDVSAGIVHWPMSVIRLKSKNKASLVALGERILTAWRAYSDPSVGVLAYTEEKDENGSIKQVPHNTITPIARRRGKDFELDLVLRCNICTEEHPMGLFHPHSELHHIKKENIGLIEVMGLAVLPARLKSEMSLLCEALCKGSDISNDEVLSKHHTWAQGLKDKHSDLFELNKFDSEQAQKEAMEAMLENEIGLVFSTVLEHAGVFKLDEEGQKAFDHFTATL